MSFKSFCCSILMGGIVGCAPILADAQPPHLNQGAAVECVVDGVDNLYRVSSDLYRSGQPSRIGFMNLEKLGLKSVINLREYHCDEMRVLGTSIAPLRYRLAAGSITEEEVEQVLRMIQRAPKPVLLHCWHGSDRTGCMVAAYRIVEQDWTVEQAVGELLLPEYGHHRFWYSNIPELLRQIDWDSMRNRLKSLD